MATMPTASAAMSEADTGLWQSGWYRFARPLRSPNFGPRPTGVQIDLIVLHSISLPPGRYGGDEVQQLFTNSLDWDAHPYFCGIRGLEVSAHFYVRRNGELWQFVSCDDRAWHAGASSWRGRSNCNDDSIGIELEGLEGDTFEHAQYETLASLCPAIAQRAARKIRAPASTGACCASSSAGISRCFRPTHSSPEVFFNREVAGDAPRGDTPPPPRQRRQCSIHAHFRPICARKAHG